MSKWKGSLISTSAATSSGTAYTGRADGKWSAQDQIQANKAGLWSIGVGAPSVPVIGTATAGNTNATVEFTPSNLSGGGTVIYTATSTPSSITGTASSSPITVSGLTNGTSYTFTVKASNSLGYTSAESATSNSIIPIASISTILGTSNSASPFIWGYTFNELSGFTSSYAPPSSALPGNTFGIDILTDKSAVVISSLVSPFLNAYSWNNGFGSKFSDPLTALASSSFTDLKFNHQNNVVFCGNNATPYINAYNWSALGFGTKFSNPSTLPAGTNVLSIISNNNDSIVISSQSLSPFVIAYNWNNTTGFGSKLSDPSTLPPNSVYSLRLSPNEATIALGNTITSPYVTAYNWNNTTGFGSKLSDPVTTPSSIGRFVNFKSTGDYLAVGTSGAPYAIVYNWSNGFGSKVSDPVTPLTSGNSVLFSIYGTSIFCGGGLSPYISAYSWANGFGSKFADPTILPTAAGCQGMTNF